VDLKKEASLDEALKHNFDLFINADIDDVSCALSSRVRTRSFKGFVYDEYGHKKSEGLWFKYMEHMDEKSFLNMLHYSDVISTASGFPVHEKVDVDFRSPVTNEMTLFSYGPYGIDNKVNLDGVEWVSNFDREGFLEYLPSNQIKLTESLFYGFVYRSIWKCTVNRTIKAGDPQRFMSLGETYLDRMVDIDREVDQLSNRTFKKFFEASVADILSVQTPFLELVTKVKELAFEGGKVAKEFLAASSKEVHDISEIKKIKARIQEIENAIYRTRSTDNYASPLIDLFRTEGPVDDVKNLFPMAKSIILSFEDLFSRASFTGEMISGLCKKMQRGSNGEQNG